MKSRNDIGLEEIAHVAERHLLERAGEWKPGAVDQDVHPSVVGMDFVDESCHSGLVGDVECACL
jgi:hypothetical protein